MSLAFNSRRSTEPRKGVCQDCLWASGLMSKTACEHETIWKKTGKDRCTTTAARGDDNLCGPSGKLWESRKE